MKYNSGFLCATLLVTCAVLLIAFTTLLIFTLQKDNQHKVELVTSVHEAKSTVKEEMERKFLERESQIRIAATEAGRLIGRSEAKTELTTKYNQKFDSLASIYLLEKKQYINTIESYQDSIKLLSTEIQKIMAILEEEPKLDIKTSVSAKIELGGEQSFPEKKKLTLFDLRSLPDALTHILIISILLFFPVFVIYVKIKERRTRGFRIRLRRSFA